MAADPRTGGHPGTPARARATVAALAITQTVGYGTLYYAFAVFLTPLATELHTTTTAITGTFTASILTAAILAVPVGRWLDRHGGRALMTAGSLLGALLLVAWSRVESLWQLYAVQIGLGAAGAASLYEAAFAVVIAWHTARQRPNALLVLTVVAGFASTVFLPLTGHLVDGYGWRTALLVLAAIQALLTVPLHATVLRPAPPVARAARSPRRLDRAFWLLALGFTANTAAISLITVHLVAALLSWGHPLSFAATTAGLFGVLSVTGRLATTALQRRFRTATVVAAVFTVQAVAVASLPFTGRSTIGAVAGVVGFGLGFGVATVAKPVLLADRYGIRHYATIAATLVVPMTIAKATAPLGAAALLARAGSYTGVFLTTAVLCVLAATALGLTRPPPPPERCPP